MSEHKRDTILLRGIGVSPGIVIGRAYVVDSRVPDTVKYCHIDQSATGEEIRRFEEALNTSRKQLERIKNRLKEEGKAKEHIAIIDAYLMILGDQMLIDETKRLIKEKKMNAEWALKEVLKDIVELFDSMDDRYFKERSQDIEHIVDRIIMNLSGQKRASITEIDEPSIIVAHELSPTDTAQMSRTKVLAFLTDVGGKTSHTAIMARSLEIPAVVGLEDITRRVRTGDTMIVDGLTGAVIINPSKGVVDVYRKRSQRYEQYNRMLHHYKDMPAETLDGKRIKLLGNIEIAEEIGSLLEHGAEGIGLYRSEFLYLNRKNLPTEEEHLAAYSYVARLMNSRPVVIRTLDLGGDKFLPMEPSVEINPAMGLRAIRFCFKRPDIFRTQLRAILRASKEGNIKIMFPMISGIEEIRRAKAYLEEAKEELKREGKGFDDNIKVGVMIEVPSAALIADLLAQEVDFFSIGTNDLLQYSLAIDRVNEHVAYLYEPFHPAVLRIIKGVVDSARKHNIEVSVCGEMAGEIEHALIFIGLGIEQLSMNANSLLKVKRLIRSINYRDAQEITERVLQFSTATEVEGFVASRLKDFYKEEFWSVY